MSLTNDIKPPIEFHKLDLSEGWETATPYPTGPDQKMLSGLLDEENGVGVRTRLIRFKPGDFVPDQFVHEYWEEVYLIEGELVLGDETFTAPCYACRPPGTPHGPFSAPKGCVFFEIQYYA